MKQGLSTNSHLQQLLVDDLHALVPAQVYKSGAVWRVNLQTFVGICTARLRGQLVQSRSVNLCAWPLRSGAAEGAALPRINLAVLIRPRAALARQPAAQTLYTRASARQYVKRADHDTCGTHGISCSCVASQLRKQTVHVLLECLTSSAMPCAVSARSFISASEYFNLLSVSQVLGATSCGTVHAVRAASCGATCSR